MNRLMIRTLGLAVLLVLAATTAWAGSGERKGTSGATELLIPVGARGSALGGTATSNVSGIEATFWNPAGLGTLEGTEALFTHTQYIADMSVNYAAIAVKSGGFGTLGFSAKVLSIGDIIVTTEQAPDGTGEIMSPTFGVFGVSWGRQFTDRVQFGAGVNYVNESIGSARASGVAFDFGLQYLTGFSGLQFGIVMKNFGTTMSFDGADFDNTLQPPSGDPSQENRTYRSTSSSFEMPSYFTLSANYDLLNGNQQRLAILGAFSNNNFSFDDLTGGLEWVYRDDYALRASYFTSFGSTTDANGEDAGVEFESGNDLYSGFALGAGAKFRAGDTGKIGVDLSWRPVTEFFEDVVEFGFSLTF